MNDKLKQSLDGRLGGMRWGERDQAEVFRQIQRKELQDVKHVKRGTGALAIAIALLFVVMGAAFALNHAPQPEDQRVAVQPTDTAILPISTALYENEYFTLTIDSSTCTASEAAFTGTIRMKNPADTMLSLASHTPPGDAGRTRLPVNFSCGISTQLPGDMPMACGSLRELDVLSMTADTTVFRMSGEVASLHEDVTFTLWINWTNPADSTAQSGELIWSIAAPEQPGMLLAEYDLVTVTLADYTAEDGIASLALDVTPAKPWYVLNRQEEGKATLTVSAEPLLLYPTFDPQDMLGMVDARDPIAGEMPVTLTQSPEGLRLTAEGPLPAAETLYGYIVLHVYSDAAEAHYDEGFDDHYYEVCVPVVPLVEAVEAAPTATPAPLPQPTATPAPQRPEPTGTYLCGTEHFLVYLEDSWHDGFSAEATLRVRANDPSYFLDVTPHKLFWPDGDVWIVGLKGGRNDDLNTSVIPAKGRDTTTGDVIIRLTYQNLYGDISQFTTPLTLTMTHEKTQARESTEIVLWPEPAEYPRQPLQLIGGSDTDAFLRAATVTTDRYHYIGVMSTRDNTYSGLTLADAYGSILASSYRPIHIISTAEDSKLFPAAGEGYANLNIVRLDKTTPLPDVLNVHFQSENRQDLPHFMLSSGSPDAQTVIHENEYVLITLHSDWYDGRSAILTLQATLKNPDAYAFVESADSTPPDGKLGVALTPMVGWSNESFSRHGWMTLSRPWSLDNSILWQARAFDIDLDEDELLIGGYLWLTTPSGEETIAINHAIPQTGLWQEYTLTPIAPTETIRFERATLHGGTHASYYALVYVAQDSAGPLTLRIASVNDAPLSIYAAQTGDADGLLCTSIVAQTRLAEQTAVIEVCTADGQVLEEIVCQIEKAITP